MRRAYLTKREWSALLEAQGGVCCVEGCESTDNLQGEHSTPHALKAGKPDQIMCGFHHRLKTKRDVREIARAKRLNGETLSQAEKRKRFGSTMQSKPFPKDWRRNPHG